MLINFAVHLEWGPAVEHFQLIVPGVYFVLNSTDKFDRYTPYYHNVNSLIHNGLIMFLHTENNLTY